jgi:hypothetical protein
MDTEAVILRGPKDIGVGALGLTDPGPGDLVVDIAWSGISTGTEKLFWTGDMPPFPGMGYPLVPGYEAAGEVVAAGSEAPFKPGDHVFVPGADCFKGARGLFGGAAARVVTDARRRHARPHRPRGAEPRQPHLARASRGRCRAGLPDGLRGSRVSEDDSELGERRMSLDEVPNLRDYDTKLREEAAEPTLEVPQGAPTKKTQIIAIYGKGGIGKSFTLANLSHMMAEQGKRVLADRLRPEIGHDIASVRRQGLPDDHRNLDAEETRR